MALSLTKIATDLVAALGYSGVTFGLVVDSAGVPIPSEVLLPLAGALARQGRMSLAAVITIGILAQSAGAVLAYWIGRTGGLAFVRRYGKYVLFSERELELTQRWFASYGTRLSFFGRMFPVIRTYVAYPAGLAEMSFGRFMSATLAGSAGWTLVLVYLGYTLGDKLEVIDQAFHRFNLIVLALLVVGVIWYIKRHLTHKS